ncbi:MAG: hypothetical protein KAG53_10810 [Endozoicomonadaceae bacterium]|nr:hypothetical protein [Endozoicomonadaceae bacterium]
MKAPSKPFKIKHLTRRWGSNEQGRRSLQQADESDGTILFLDESTAKSEHHWGVPRLPSAVTYKLIISILQFVIGFSLLSSDESFTRSIV